MDSSYLFIGTLSLTLEGDHVGYLTFFLIVNVH